MLYPENYQGRGQAERKENEKGKRTEEKIISGVYMNRAKHCFARLLYPTWYSHIQFLRSSELSADIRKNSTVPEVWGNLWYSWKEFLNIASLQRNKTNHMTCSILFAFPILFVNAVLLYKNK